MKFVMIVGPRQVRLEEREVPRVGPGDLLVRLRACGICGTDIEKIHGSQLTPPLLGHELSGEIVERGSEVIEFEIGQRVAVHHHVPCYTCHYCARGAYTMCELFPQTNLDPCGLSEYFRVPGVNVQGGAVHPLRHDVSFEEGALAEPTGCCIRGLMKTGGVQPGDSIAIFGAGPVGLTHLQLALTMGASQVLVGDILNSRLRAAMRFGASAAVNVKESGFIEVIRAKTENRGADLTIVATPNTSAIPDAIRATRKGGRVLLFGAPEVGSNIQYDASDVFIREISLIPSYSTSEREISFALQLIEAKRIDVGGLITHRFDFKDTLSALAVAESDADALKVMIVN